MSDHPAPNVHTEARPTMLSSIHPLIARVPAALLVTSFALDAVQLLPRTITESFPSLADKMPPQESISSFSHLCNTLGVLGSIPSAATGFGEIKKLIGSHKTSPGETFQQAVTQATAAARKGDQEGVKITRAILHATLNALIVTVAAFNWFARRHSDSLQVPPFNALLSLIALPALLFSVLLGASIYHGYGVGKQGHTRKKSQ